MKEKASFVLALAWILIPWAQGKPLKFPMVPDPSLTSGVLCSRNDHDYSEDRYGQNIPVCRRNVSKRSKIIIFEVYKVPPDCHHEFTIDHFYPLSLGGNNGFKNLWPEHKSIKALRRHLEQELYMDVRDGFLTPKMALRKIRWEKTHPPVDENETLSICHQQFLQQFSN